MSMSRERVLEWAQALPPKSTVFIDEGGLTLCCPEATKEGYLEIGGESEEDEEGFDICSICGVAFPAKTLESRWGDGDQEVPEGQDDFDLICDECAEEQQRRDEKNGLYPGVEDPAN